MVLRPIDSFKFITCALAKFPERFNLPWKKGDFTSTPMSDYNTMDAVISYYGWLMFSVNASLETNGIDPTSSFSTAGFSLKAYRHSFYDGSIMDLSSWDVKRRSSAMEDYWFNEILIRERGLKVVNTKLYEEVKSMDTISQQIPCINSTGAIGTDVTSVSLIVKMSDLLHQSVIMRFWKLDTILK
jgi:hypothetical protein